MAKPKGKPNPPTTGTHWGARVAARRTAMGYTQEAFAALLSVNLRTLQGWEAGRRTSIYADIFDGIITRIEAEHERAAKKAAKKAA